MADNAPTAKVWLRRARGSLTRARLYGGVEGTFYEDSCFDAQQGAEKALKAVLIHMGRSHPRTHAIADPITIVEEAGAQVSNDLRQASRLTAYAVSARYPGVAEEVTEKEYREAVELSDRVVTWAEALIYSADSSEGNP